VIAGGPLVHVRTPAYRRPEALRRCLGSLQAQTWSNWICDVYDDDPDQNGAAVCAELADPRVRYTPNTQQKLASRNIDGCFTSENPHHADYFCVLEDDNFLLPAFFAENIALCRKQGVNLVLRNQFIELGFGTPEARLSEAGVLDELFTEGIFEPAAFRLSLLMGIGVSNGGLFWSRSTRSALEIGYRCTATTQEYMRTFSISEPIYVAMTPLGAWAENGALTTRNADIGASYLRRELDLKRAIQTLQRKAWQTAGEELRAGYLANPAFAADERTRARGLAKALIWSGIGDALSLGERTELRLRGLLIALGGRLTADFDEFMRSRLASPESPSLPLHTVTGGSSA
jgi:glycosyltransferase involved in cell wall biosynthesis